MKSRKGGSSFYQGMKAVVCHVPEDVFKQIKRIQDEEMQSLEIVARLLICYALKKKPDWDELKAALPKS